MQFIPELAQFVESHFFLAYAIIFLGVIIEGEFILLAAGILAHLGILSVGGTLLLAISGGVGKTVFGYYLGRWLSGRFPKNRLMLYLQHRVSHYLPHFAERPFWSIFTSKFIYGVNHFVIIFAGYVRAHFKTFFKAEFFSSLIWIPGIFCVGYFFSYTAFSWSRDFRKASLFIIIFVVGFIVFQKVINAIIEYFEEPAEEHMH